MAPAVAFFALAALYVTPCDRLIGPRVAGARGRSLDAVLALARNHTASRELGFLREPGVNVLELDLDIDRQG